MVDKQQYVAKREKVWMSMRLRIYVRMVRLSAVHAIATPMPQPMACQDESLTGSHVDNSMLRTGRAEPDECTESEPVYCARDEQSPGVGWANWEARCKVFAS